MSEKVYKATRSVLAEKLLLLDGKPMSFGDYEYQRSMYDCNSARILQKTGRQVGKCQRVNSPILDYRGNWIQAQDIKIGNILACMDTGGVKTTTGIVTWVSSIFKKSCLKIKTLHGKEIEVALTHPIRTWNGWTEAQNLKIGDKIAAVRKACEFGILQIPKERIRLTGYLLGDGLIGTRCLRFAQVPGVVLDEFLNDIKNLNGTVRIEHMPNNKALNIHIHDGIVWKWMREDGLWGSRSFNKHLPNWVFNLNAEDTAMFINRIWSTDGHCGNHKKNGYTISYCSISLKLIQQLQTLLFKFGVPSSIRWSNTTKRGYKAYELSVITHEGKIKFLTEIGALGKSDKIPIPNHKPNSPYDTYPLALCDDIIKILSTKKKHRHSKDRLQIHATSNTKKSHLTKQKLKDYIDFFRSDQEFNQTMVDDLEKHLNTDLYWEKIIEITDIGEQDCIDFEVADYHNFIVNGIITHNSTLCSNFILTESIATPFFRTLYLSPSKEQSSKFSATRLSKTLKYSPLIRNYVSSDKDNIFLKILSNGSEIAISYADDDPDRTRGISSDRLFLDEAQDIDLSTVLPVVRETLANSDYGYETFCGTPRSLENGLEWLWSQSSQTEWIMKCGKCSRFNFIDSDRSIGKTGPQCIKCGGILNPRNGQWYDFKPGAGLKGFHVSQLQLCKNVEVPERWQRILHKYETYSRPQFNNEVLGISDAIGTRMISKEELEDMCEDYTITQSPNHKEFSLIVGGVDWSGGGTQATSRTVCWVWGLTHGKKIKTIYFKIFPGRNQVEDVREVANIFAACKVTLVCGDAGEGAVANAMLKEKLGQHKVYQVQYGSLSSMFKWNGKDRWIVDKAGFIDSFMLLLKRQGAVFPNILSMREPIEDVLAEYEEVTQSGLGRKIWTHSPTRPDDSLQAMVFGWIALKIATGELNLYQAQNIQA